MVAITTHHRIDIALPPVFEVKMVVVGILLLLPHVERFVDDHHSQAVADVQEYRRGWVVAAPNRVVAIRFEQLDTPLFSAINCRRAKRAVVMVDACPSE